MVALLWIEIEINMNLTFIVMTANVQCLINVNSAECFANIVYVTEYAVFMLGAN